LSGLLLASLCHSLSARHHEYWSDGSCHSHNIRRENAALAAACTLHRGCRAFALWCAGDYVTPTSSHFPERGQRSDACRNADEDARERQRTCHQVTDRKSPMSAFDPKRTSRGPLDAPRAYWWSGE